MNIRIKIDIATGAIIAVVAHNLCLFIFLCFYFICHHNWNDNDDGDNDR